MQSIQSAWRRFAFAAVAVTFGLALPSCSKSVDPTLGTFRLGERVQIGPAIYNVLESEWKTALTEGGRAPQNRFLFIKISVTNSGGSTLSMPTFQLQGRDGTKYPEVTQN